MTFSDQLRRWRNADATRDGRGDFSQEVAASRLGVPLRTYQDWEQGRRKPQGLAYQVVSAKINLLEVEGAGRRVAPSNRKATAPAKGVPASKKRVTHEKKNQSRKSEVGSRKK